MSKKCGICNNKLGILTTVKLKDGNICPMCAKICQSCQTESIENIKEFWNINHQRFNTFTKSLELKSFMSEIINVDDEHKLFYIGKIKKIEPIIFSFDEVVDYKTEIIGQKTVSKKKGGLTRAVVGGVVAGPVGAFVGSNTAKVETKNVGGMSLFIINFIMKSGNYKVSIQNPPSGFEKFLDKCINNQMQKKNNSDINTIEEIKKYKELLNSGIISEEEFALKKKQLLNI